MLLFIDPNGGTSYDIVVCLTSVGVSDSVSVVDASSACGPDKSPGTLEISYSFEGQHLQDSISGKISGSDLRFLLRDETTIGWMMAPEIPVAGDEIHTGTGYLSELSSTYSFDSVGTFTGTIQPYGEPVITIEGGGGGGLVVGQAYQGGKIAYLDNSGNHGIIFANQSYVMEWCQNVGTVFGATFSGYGEGTLNMNPILTQAFPLVNSAGYVCDFYQNEGYTDFVVPTSTDLTNIYNAGGFAACGYGSIGSWSEEFDGTFANYVSGVDGSINLTPKNVQVDVIPIRYF
jgi:hypothetical protein